MLSAFAFHGLDQHLYEQIDNIFSFGCTIPLPVIFQLNSNIAF